MGARPSSFKKGGGFLNNVDGVIAGYQFTDEFNGVAFTPGRDPKTKKEKFHSLYAVLSARIDGADEDITTTLFVGAFDDFDISEDGHVLTPVEDGRELGAGTSWAKFITSLVEAGFPEGNLPEDSIDFSSIIGTRVRFKQQTDVEGTKRLGKRKDKKTGKEYDRQDLIVETVYDLPGSKPATAGKGKAKPAAAAAGKVKAKPAAAETEEDGVDIQELSGTTLVAVLEANDGTIAKAKLGLQILKQLGTKHPQREDVRAFLADDANLATLAEEGLITYNKAKGQIAVA